MTRESSFRQYLQALRGVIVSNTQLPAGEVSLVSDDTIWSNDDSGSERRIQFFTLVRIVYLIKEPNLDPENQESGAPRVFRLCQRCGRPTPAQSPECVNCGARSLQDVVTHDQARAEQAFARAYFARGTPVTFAILGFNLIAYLVMTLAAGGDTLQQLIFGVDSNTLIAFGAKTNELLGVQHQWFRLVTPIFIHVGLLHIASNSYALWMVGPQVERLYGSARFAVAYLISGIAGVVGSYIATIVMGTPTSVPSVGASGAIFGLFAMLAVFGYKYRRELPPNFQQAFGSRILPVIAINLIFGFSIKGIDNGGHIGGLVCGAILALVVPYVAPGKERKSPIALALAVASLLLVGYSFVKAAQTGAEHFSRRPALLTPFLAAINEGQAAMIRSMRVGDDAAGRASSARELADAAIKADDSRGLDPKSEEILRRLALLLRDQRAALDEDDAATRRPKLEENAKRFSSIDEDLRAWVAVEGKKAGITQTDSDK